MKKNLIMVLILLSLAISASSTAAQLKPPVKDAANPASTQPLKTTLPFKQWLYEHIPAQYPGVQVVAHDNGEWFQARISELDLVVSWAELTETSIALKKVEGLREGKSISDLRNAYSLLIPYEL